jgi:hypothetical protein
MGKNLVVREAQDMRFGFEVMSSGVVADGGVGMVEMDEMCRYRCVRRCQ